MSNEISMIILMFVVFLFGIMSGFPLGFVLGGVGVIFGFFVWGFNITYMSVIQIYNTLDNYILLAIPLFIFMANVMSQSGISERLFGKAPLLFGSIRGGVGVSVMLIATLLAACTGIVGASVTTMGLTALPIMRKQNFDKNMSLGIVCAGGSLGILIPPSIMLVTMASYTTLSVGKLFAGALLPGLLLSFLYICYILIRCYLQPQCAPSSSSPKSFGKNIKLDIIEILLKDLLPAVAIIFGVLGSILLGIATVTEAASVGVLLTFLLMTIYRQFSWDKMFNIITSTAKTSCMVLTTILGAAVFSSTFFGLGGKKILLNLLEGFNISNWAVFLIVMSIFFFLGFIMDWVQIVPLCFPIFLPLLVQMGFNELWSSVLIALILQTAFMTPPVGAALFYLRGVAPDDVTINNIIRGIVPFTAIVIIAVIICLTLPDIVLWLPKSLFG